MSDLDRLSARIDTLEMRFAHQDQIIEDLNSTNGIYVRAKRVRRRMLNDGDVVQIGQHEIMYFDDRMARTRVTILTSGAVDTALHAPADNLRQSGRRRALFLNREDSAAFRHTAGPRGLSPADELPRTATLNLIGGRTHEQSLG